ncbi:hypothetical protein [Undibacterium sp. SXout20W]|uniref:hypothetical protein n=1 Tax=Undibacterium sp. SXout20W TaxID=3413051 RepID=UPI003BF3E5B2
MNTTNQESLGSDAVLQQKIAQLSALSHVLSDEDSDWTDLIKRPLRELKATLGAEIAAYSTL